MKVAVLGASDRPDRYSYLALMLLREKEHDVFPVHPRLKEIEGATVYASLKDLPGVMDTLTLYVSKNLSTKISEDILNARARDKGIETLQACTLTMLKTGQF